jgi:hypothetical protein
MAETQPTTTDTRKCLFCRTEVPAPARGPQIRWQPCAPCGRDTPQTKEREMPNASAERRRATAVITIATRTAAVAWTADRRIYSVPSQSTPESHLVEIWSNGAARCDCTAAHFGRSCTHIAAVLLAREWWRLAARRQPVGLRAAPCRKRRYVRAA